ncbi:uncharacterized protein cubi_00064 [Cryptosporidium ubiquitum]|uniref:Uncharacterized protein n=1 Tax=Cryptosporidium ubiquitum TaxID=857276 RepID=A0A1J4MKF8_9CRYT|nr:uncharacterized protein cubi_00064 [Cryptosporidium ubiquitum]OII74511.1 hypothetical protein cubi_00064 [Cryptosporidium ubiquitum]
MPELKRDCFSISDVSALLKEEIDEDEKSLCLGLVLDSGKEKKETRDDLNSKSNEELNLKFIFKECGPDVKISEKSKAQNNERNRKNCNLEKKQKEEVKEQKKEVSNKQKEETTNGKKNIGKEQQKEMSKKEKEETDKNKKNMGKEQKKEVSKKQKEETAKDKKNTGKDQKKEVSKKQKEEAAKDKKNMGKDQKKEVGKKQKEETAKDKKSIGKEQKKEVSKKQKEETARGKLKEVDKNQKKEFKKEKKDFEKEDNTILKKTGKEDNSSAKDFHIKIPYRETNHIPSCLFEPDNMDSSDPLRISKYNVYIHETSRLFSVDTACRYVFIKRISRLDNAIQHVIDEGWNAFACKRDHKDFQNLMTTNISEKLLEDYDLTANVEKIEGYEPLDLPKTRITFHANPIIMNNYNQDLNIVNTNYDYNDNLSNNNSNHFNVNIHQTISKE